MKLTISTFSIIRGATLICITLLIFFLLSEVCTRLLLPDPRVLKFPFSGHYYVKGLLSPHPLRNFTYSSNFSGRSTLTNNYDIVYETNSFGLRDSEVNSNLDGRTRLLALGNSYTAGTGVTQADTWPEKLESIIHAMGYSFESINAGVAGYGMRQIRQMATEFVPILNPELVVLGIYMNGYDRIDDPYTLIEDDWVRQSSIHCLRPIDRNYYYYSCSYVNRNNPSCLERLLFGSRAIIYFKKLYDNIKVRLSVFKGPLVSIRDRLGLGGPPTDDVFYSMMRELEIIGDFLAQRNIPLVVLLINEQDRDGSYTYQQEMNEIIKEYHNHSGWLIIDPLPALKNASRGEPLMRFRDDGHWTPLAHEIAATEIAGIIPSLINLVDTSKSHEGVYSVEGIWDRLQEMKSLTEEE